MLWVPVAACVWAAGMWGAVLVYVRFCNRRRPSRWLWRGSRLDFYHGRRLTWDQVLVLMGLIVVGVGGFLWVFKDWLGL